ncbi:Gfo/Idh/MocA family oxidoreductase [Sanguibacter sp. HDW7]|uniref:Gfo/Idh/MocA family protein n=1 Tax=Sanguibacter sp. HDW7 TaxID=2714931 RepID=UPI00140BEB74|nr:Gfo/Idh/MocA family oxidoreductase [Sanguibacter sp. HDW7]QIK84098.1 Gfo/Idh/MocA family oxidoreductase [Sanguibacter sp. HDW7]
MTDVKVGILGYGLGGAAFHAPFVASTPGLELAAVVTGRAAAAEEIGRRYPGTHVLPDADALWAAGVDLVVVTTPNRTHVPLARAALERGLGVVVDKPAAPDGATLRGLGELADARGALLTVFHNRRWDDDHLTVRRLLGEGTLGEVRRYEARWEYWRPAARGGWRESADPADLPGLLHDLGTHVVDQAVDLLGPVATVYAETDVRRSGVGADDDAFVALTHVGGARSHLSMNALVPSPGPRLRVVGERAQVESWGLDPQEDALRAGRHPVGDGLADDGTLWGARPSAATMTLTTGTPDGTTTSDVPYVPGDHGAFYEMLAAAADGRGPVPVSVESAAVTLDVVAAAHRAAATGQVQTVGLG